MRFSLFNAAALATVITSVLAQTIDPNSVSLSTRDAWCLSQTSQCPLICTQENDGSAATLSNDCDPDTLDYSCVCGNGLTPNATEYSQTIPYYICTQYNTNCVASCGLNNNACAAACVQNHPCGARDPTRVNASTITTSATSTSLRGASTASDGSAVYTGFGGSAATTTAASTNGQKSGAGAAHVVRLGEIYGFGVVVAGFLAGFSLLL